MTNAAEDKRPAMSKTHLEEKQVTSLTHDIIDLFLSSPTSPEEVEYQNKMWGEVNECIRSHPTSPNTPSPEVIDTLVEACRILTKTHGGKVFNDAFDVRLAASHRGLAILEATAKSQFALALIDGEKK